ncbi:MAG: hypothetical protein RL095_3375 [Verrucomicrobiota bacterium]
MNEPKTKAECRRYVRYALRSLTESEREEASARLNQLLLDEISRVPGAVAAFLPAPLEPDINPVLRQLAMDGRLLLPRHSAASGLYELAAADLSDLTELILGPFGIPEPGPATSRGGDPALWLVPGLAFTRGGIRLGRGGGFYDRLLQTSSGRRLGIAFKCQILDHLPSEAHDQRMDAVLAE